ncbi:MAG: hypothetical protein JNL64_12600 [Blastocatellia bacterium]|nr:hypothetical protein [Blastocatellia bacterium]
MISPNANEDERIQDVKIREHARSLRNKYPKSGLYLVGKSEKSLWSIDWYSGKVWLSNDGSYLISSNGISNLNDKNEIRLDSQVLSFYFEGKESRIYRFSDLVKNSSKLPGAPRFVFWACRGTFDEINDRFTVVTFDFQEHVFESDGQLVSTTGLSKIPCNSPFDIQFE